ncbi:hypothetical protein M0802_016333 [Mischocyttarus mexicanus]|nr:hypothetical protein M0802_016333 [Mischocyttarus mexicanus]
MQYCLNSQKPADCKSNLYKLAIKTLDNIDEVTLDQLDPHQHNAQEIIWLALTGSYRVSPRIGQDIKSTYFPTNEFLMIGNDNMEKNKIGDKLLLKNDYAHISPMETRVYPDGRPVPDNRKKFRPIDDDIDEYTMEKLPSISDIEKNSDKNVHRNKVLNNGRRGSLHRFTRRISIEDDNNDDPDLDDDDDDDD